MSRLADTVMQKARQQTGLSDFGDDWFLESLEAYLGGLNGPQISDFGRAFLARQAVKDLSRRLAIIDCLKRNPAIEETPIPPILYITGHERSGTTLLHNLLALHASGRYLSRWELMLPTPPPEAATFHEDPRRIEVKQSIDALRGTDLEKMHWVEADDPEECVWGFMDCTGMVGMAPSLVLPRWSEWLETADLTPSFINYRKIIQLLTWKNPLHEGGFLVLTPPKIASYRVLTSFCTLSDIVNGPFLTDRNYPEKQDREESFCLKRMGRVYSRMMDFEAAHPERVRNMQYVDLLESTVDEITGVYRELNFAPDGKMAVKIQDFLAAQKAGGRARPRQEMTTHGYTREQLERTPAVASYLKRYNVVLEPTRNMGVN